MTRASPWQSIEWRLPALMGLLLLLVVGALTLLGYRSLERTLLAAAQERLAAATHVLGDALRPGFNRRLAALQQAAVRPEVADLFVDPDAGRSGAQSVLGEVVTGNTGASQAPVTLSVLTDDHRC